MQLVSATAIPRGVKDDCDVSQANAQILYPLSCAYTSPVPLRLIHVYRRDSTQLNFAPSREL